MSTYKDYEALMLIKNFVDIAYVLHENAILPDSVDTNLREAQKLVTDMCYEYKERLIKEFSGD